jgi:hypothetical protein
MGYISTTCFVENIMLFAFFAQDFARTFEIDIENAIQDIKYITTLEKKGVTRNL